MEAELPLRQSRSHADQLFDFVRSLELRQSRLAPSHGLLLAAMSVGLGFMADLLFNRANLGINVGVWVGCLLLALAAGARQTRASLRPVQIAFLATSLVFACLVALRDSPILRGFDCLAGGGLLLLAVAIPPANGRRRIGLVAFAYALLIGGLSLALGTWRLVERLPRQSWLNRRVGSQAVLIVRALLAAVLLLSVFGGLFAAADEVFRSELTGLVRLDLRDVVLHTFWIAAGTWIAAGIFWAGVAVEAPSMPDFELPDRLRLKAVETSIVLGSLVVLFAAFVLVQLRYLFGGKDLVERSIGLTYADYAHRGFFELVVASGLLLPVVLCFNYLGPREGTSRNLFRGLALALTGLLYVIMASALQRLHVYEQAFGLTELRLYAAAGLVCLGVVFLCFLATIFRKRQEDFAWGALAAVAVTVLALNALSPDAVIARTNTDRLNDRRAFDVLTAAHLSADAVPVLIDRLDRLAPAEQCQLAQALLLRWQDSSDDIRSWNRSRSRAVDAVKAHRSELELACAGNTR